MEEEEEEDGHIRLKANTDLCTTGLYLKSLHNVSIYLFTCHKHSYYGHVFYGI